MILWELCYQSHDVLGTHGIVVGQCSSGVFTLLDVSKMSAEIRLCARPLLQWRCLRSLSTGGQKKPSYWHNPGTRPLSPVTVGQLIDIAAEKWAHREALVSVPQDHRLTFHQLREQADRLAAGLLKNGVKPGDRVGLWGPNSSQWYVSFMAAARAGFILVNINPAYQVEELRYSLQKVGVKALIMADTHKTQNYPAMLRQIAPEIENSQPGLLQSDQLPQLRSAIVISDNHFPGTFRFSDVLENVTGEELVQVQQLQQEIQPDEGYNLQFTSGTTGKPKAPLLTHHGTVNNVRTIGKGLGLNLKEHRVCLQVPFFHCFGNVVGVLSALTYGATIVLPDPGFNPKNSLKAIKQERCTMVYGTPTMYVDLVRAAKEAGDTGLDTLETALISGAPFSSELIQKMKSTLQLNRVYTVYGLTETSPVVFQSLPDEPQEKVLTTVGKLLEHVEAKVVDANGKMVPMGTAGELWVRGYVNMLGYWNDEEKTKDMIRADRWVKTGDQFVLEEDGYGRVVGRLKDMIIRGGENIFPKEIEDFLEQHPNILEVQVIGVPDERMGEELCACIRLTNDATMTIEDLRNYCKGKISHFKIPRYIKIMDEFPKTLSGKVQKFKLRDLVVEEQRATAG